ncbi:MAG TPA: S8 family serine peptidase, partial [Rhodothermales bacterium]|nr:S8 family serine peptidase [Rhodothermales bacterium]
SSYAVTVNTNPAGQTCTVSNGSGVIGSSNVTNVSVACASLSFVVSGTASAVSVTAVDSDTNDPLQQGRASNNSPSTAQRVGNPALVVGYVNNPGTGPQGPNFAAGDIFDGYRVTLAAGQVVELNFADPSSADLDLWIYNSTGTVLLAGSFGTTRSECVRITTSGEYQVVVDAFSGYATYELAWGPVSLGTTCANATAAAPDKPSFVAGQLLAKARKDRAGESRLARTAALARSANLRVASQSSEEGPVLLEVPAPTSPIGGLTQQSASYRSSGQARHALHTAATLKELRASGQFEYVELNGVVEPQQVGYGPWPPNDAHLNKMPHLDLIKLPATFNALNSLNPRPAYTPIVAVLDTGIVADHPDLTRMLVTGYDFVSSSSNSGDGNGIDTNPDDSRQPTPGAVFHGTHVAGTIAAETFNGTGIVGVAPMARIMPVRVLGLSGGTFNDIIQGLLYAAALPNSSGTVPTRKADVINMSLGAQGSCPTSVRDTIQQVRAQGVVVVAAAGNNSGQPVGTPANCQGVIAVSASAYSGALSTYSNIGPEVVVTAPGGDSSRQSPAGADVIYSTHATFTGTLRIPNYAGLQGTSMAAPHVAGVIALMRAVNSTITPAQIDTLFANGSLTDDVGAAGRDTQFGFGMINAFKAINAAAVAAPPPSGLPTLALSTTRLDFGTVQTQLQITLTRINGSTDKFSSATDSATNPAAVTVVEAAGNPANGPYVLNVTVNRQFLNLGEDLVQVEITSTQGRKLRFDVAIAPRTSTPTGLLGVGPVYVLAVDPNTFDTLAQQNVINNATTYPYSLTNLSSPVIIVAGTDTDNDGFICGPSEPCGAYPVLGPGISVLSDSRSGVNFDLIPAGSVSGQSMQTQLPARGFRIR